MTNELFKEMYGEWVDTGIKSEGVNAELEAAGEVLREKNPKRQGPAYVAI